MIYNYDQYYTPPAIADLIQIPNYKFPLSFIILLILIIFVFIHYISK